MENSLVPNETYSLSTKEESNQSKELFFVKLTDSSLRAVEEYLENKVLYLTFNNYYSPVPN